MEMTLSVVPNTKTREARMELTTPTLQGKSFNHHSYFVQNLMFIYFIYEPPRGKTNNVVSEQVRHKSGCTVTENG